MKIFKTKVYKVTYSNSGGFDHFEGRYILENEWIYKMILSGTATATRVN